MPSAQLLQFNPRQRVRLYDDFIGNVTANGSTGNLNWNYSNTGTGAAPTTLAAPDANHPGVLSLNTGTTTTGRGTLFGSGSSTIGSVKVNAGLVEFEGLIQIPVLSVVGDRFAFRFGFGDSNTGDFANGVYFEYDESASANWRLKTANASTRTTNDSGTVVAAGTWYRLYLAISASGTSVAYKIGDTSVGTITTNIPTLDISPIAHIIKSAGTTARSSYLDYTFLQYALATPRW